VSPSRHTAAGRAYLDLQSLARNDKRSPQEYLLLYVLEGFLARLARSPQRDNLILKGGVLLAALGERRPTRDIDLQATALHNDESSVMSCVCEIAAIADDDEPDGLVFEIASASAAVIRDEDAYSGVRVTMTTTLASARLTFHVDVNVGDPIVPPPEDVEVPRLLGEKKIVLRGYPLVMVHAEKIVTAVSRGTQSTRWRDFMDVVNLAAKHPVDGDALEASIRLVARHRGVALVSLGVALAGYGEIGQKRWAAWRKKQQLEDRTPALFAELIASFLAFAERPVAGTTAGTGWDPGTRSWR